MSKQPKRPRRSSRMRDPRPTPCAICGEPFLPVYATSRLCGRRACKSEHARRNQQRQVQMMRERRAAARALRDQQERKKAQACRLDPAIRRDLECARRRRQERLEAVFAEARAELARMEFGNIFVPRGDAAHVSTYRDDPA